MHHGYYPAGSKRKDHVQAQSDMIDEVLLWARGGGEARLLDTKGTLPGHFPTLRRHFPLATAARGGGEGGGDKGGEVSSPHLQCKCGP